MSTGCCNICSDSTGCGCCMDMDHYKEIELAGIIPNSQRHCTDIPCCLLLIIIILIEIYIIIYSKSQGANSHLITDGYDYNLNMCELVVWPSLSEYKIRICIPENNSCDDFTKNNEKMIYYYESKKFLNSYCIPTNLDKLIGSDVETNFDSFQQIIERALFDLDITKYLILSISILSIILSFIYIKIIAFIGRFLVFLTATIIIVGGAVLAGFLMDNGIEDLSHQETKTLGISILKSIVFVKINLYSHRKHKKLCFLCCIHSGQAQIILSIIIMVILIILLFIIYFERKNVKIVIEMLRESSNAINQMPKTLCTPIYFSILILIFFFFYGH